MFVITHHVFKQHGLYLFVLCEWEQAVFPTANTHPHTPIIQYTCIESDTSTITEFVLVFESDNSRICLLGLLLVYLVLNRIIVLVLLPVLNRIL